MDSNQCREWYDVSYPETGKATPVGRDVDIGETTHWVLEQSDGDLELLEPDEVAQLEFDADYVREEASFPIRKLHENRSDLGYAGEWVGPEELPVTAVWDPRGHTVNRLEFPEGLPIEDLEQLFLVDREGGDDE